MAVIIPWHFYKQKIIHLKEVDCLLLCIDAYVTMLKLNSVITHMPVADITPSHLHINDIHIIAIKTSKKSGKETTIWMKRVS